MALSSDDLFKIQQAATLGTDPNALDMELTDEVVEVYQSIVNEINALEGRVMIEPVFDWPDDRFDELIANTDAAWGEDRSIEELNAEDEAGKADK